MDRSTGKIDREKHCRELRFEKKRIQGKPFSSMQHTDSPVLRNIFRKGAQFETSFKETCTLPTASGPPRSSGDLRSKAELILRIEKEIIERFAKLTREEREGNHFLACNTQIAPF